MKFLFALFLFVVGAGFFAFNFSLGVFDDLFFRDKVGEVLQGIKERQVVIDLSLQELEREIVIPSPLNTLDAFQEEQGGLASLVSLSKDDVLQWTNAHRQEIGLSPLKGSLLLDEIAQTKVQDMFANQYFAHVSPLEVGIGDLAENAEYEFLAIGENLALGNYETSEVLVQAWMDSPGHRENILNDRYEEIGIALQQGVFEGNSIWLAVQVFARPLSACDLPSEILKTEITLGKIQSEELILILDQMREELRIFHPKSGPSYKRKVEEYNVLVERYNTLVGELQANINSYNLEVQAFNACARQ